MMIKPVKNERAVAPHAGSRQGGFLRSLLRGVTLATLGTVLAACGGAPDGIAITTPQGQVLGEITENRIANFRGIPFAQPPIGERRFRAPGPAPTWTDTLSATAFSPMCQQSTDSTPDLLDRVIDGHGLSWIKRVVIKRVAAGMGPGPVSEDCLYLNVRSADIGGKAPVMVWIHGGGHQFGSADFNLYQGDDLSQKGVVVVTINYRLGAFGYLAHPLLSQDSPDGISGNYGLQDQIAALQWVQDNIAAYGGDPSRVTLFGESAGASSIAAIMASPSANGLFHGAIGQSGESTRALMKLDEAESLGMQIVDGTVSGARTVEELRALPVSELLKVSASEDRSGSLRPIADGVILKRSAAELLGAGEFAPVPVIFGYNADEAEIFYNDPADSALMADLTGTADQRLASLEAGYGAAGAEIAKLYGLDDDARLYQGAKDLMGDEYFGVSTRYVLEAVERVGAPAWAYAFTRVPPSKTQTIGAYHSAEMAFIFGTHERALGLSDEDEALTELMQDYWVNFAKTGDPNGSDVPEWPAYKNLNWMEFSANTGRETEVIQNWRKDKIDLLSTALSPALKTSDNVDGVR